MERVTRERQERAWEAWHTAVWSSMGSHVPSYETIRSRLDPKPAPQQATRIPREQLIEELAAYTKEIQQEARDGSG